MNDATFKSDLAKPADRAIAPQPDISPIDRSGEEIDLIEVVRILWAGKWWILATMVLCAAVAVGVSLRLPNQYKATVVLMPASSSMTSSLSRLAGQFGGLASLAGIDIGGQADGEKVIAAMELLKSWGFQEQFIRNNKLELAVFAAKGWNRQTNGLIIDPSIYDVKQGKWVRDYDADAGQTAEPGGWELYKSFSKRVSVVQDKKTNLITISVEYYSPILAKAWLDQLVASVNTHLQEQDRIEAERSIRYLEDRMSQTNLAEMKTVLSSLIKEQTKNLMLARVSNEYVFRTLSPAKVPEEKSSPKRAMICVVSVLVGGVLSMMAWLMWSGFKGRSRVT